METIKLITLDEDEIETLEGAKNLLGHYIDLSNKEHGYMPLRQDAYSAYNALLNLIQHFNRCFLEVEDE